MREFRRIWTSYVATDSFLERSERASRRPNSRQRWARVRLFNDQAYYMMLFAQFEQFVESECIRLINRKKHASLWHHRRLWDSTEPERMSFMRKVALLTDKAGPNFQKIDQYYDRRCDVAHGTLLPAGAIIVPVAVQDFGQFVRDLRQ